MVDILIVDDHQLVRTGLKGILSASDTYRVVGEADTGEEALNLAKQLKPQLVLMDINMPGIGGLEATRKLRHLDPNIHVIVLTMHKEGPFPSNLIKAGAKGYITKDCGVEETMAAIETVMKGETYISSDVAQHLAVEMLTSGKDNPLDTLSQRELQIMIMILQGHKVREIADKLNLSAKTVSTYRHRLFEKLKVKNDSEMARLAMKYGLLDQ
ncbi:MAG: response regulator [Chromatiales bacterium]|nr:response regulator [Chromatiales bacterium]